jgi:histidyl-tRNA synthetase
MRDTDSLSAFVLDPSITRGLDYYTGVVFESFLDKLPGIGSVCSGGRYDNLTGLYAKEPLSGVGASVGLDRLQAALEELAGESAGAAWTLAAVACTGAEKAGKAQALAEQFRALGISCEVFLEPKTPGQQFMLAEKKGVPWVIVPALDGEGFTLRNIARREDRVCPGFSEAAAVILGRQK